MLHIGLHKTGTSTIQSVLYANREHLLRQEGVLYPSLAPNLSTSLGTVFRDDPRRQTANRIRGFTDEEIAAHQKHYLGSLDAEISSVEWETLLLSAEGVSNLSKTELASLREWGESHHASEWTVLVCVRHPVDWARSVIQQLLKRGDTLGQLYAEPRLPDYRGRISTSMSVFGRENVRVYDFRAATESEGGIVGTFAEQVGLSAPSRDLLASQAVRVNESLSSEAARILDSLNRQRPMFAGDVRATRRAGPGHELAYLSRIEGRKFDVPDSVKEAIRARSREDVAWLNETFGLDLYRDVADSAPRARARDEPVEALSDPAVDSIAGIIGELVTEKAFSRAIGSGKTALARGDLERAARMLKEAARLDPEAPQPKKLLERVHAKQTD